MVVGRLIPAGTGLTYHAERRKGREDIDFDSPSRVSASDVEQALSDALNFQDM